MDVTLLKETEKKRRFEDRSGATDEARCRAEKGKGQREGPRTKLHNVKGGLVKTAKCTKRKNREEERTLLPRLSSRIA